jgi:hypothetical protein
VDKVRANPDKFIGTHEEQEILEIAARQGIGDSSAGPALLQVCETQGYVLESRVAAQVKDLIDTFAARDGKIDEKEFNDVVAACKKACFGRRSDVQCKRLVAEIIENSNLKTSRGWFSSWYDRVKKEVGMK